ncbi:MAG: hypothetical protein ACYTG7_20080 [Planctomycetota bacterium]|jgi:phytol kinase
MYAGWDRFISFFVDNFPDVTTLALGGPAGLLWAYSCLYLSGCLKKHRGLKTGYTRKTFHFLIFMSVVAIQSIFGTPGVCLFGGMTSLVIFYAVFRGKGNLLYEAMAREKDEPHRTYFIMAPYFATLIGGLVSNILFGRAAIFGYLAAGVGDAIAEPVGTRWGRHPYRVPSFYGVPAIRSWEGSLSVFLACCVTFLVGCYLYPPFHPTPLALIMIPLFGLICAAFEAISPHGWDNAVLQIIPSLFAFYII